MFLLLPQKKIDVMKAANPTPMTTPLTAEVTMTGRSSKDFSISAPSSSIWERIENLDFYFFNQLIHSQPVFCCAWFVCTFMWICWFGFLTHFFSTFWISKRILSSFVTSVVSSNQRIGKAWVALTFAKVDSCRSFINGKDTWPVTKESLISKISSSMRLIKAEKTSWG